jgi:hypothetical protein
VLVEGFASDDPLRPEPAQIECQSLFTKSGGHQATIGKRFPNNVLEIMVASPFRGFSDQRRIGQVGISLPDSGIEDDTGEVPPSVSVCEDKSQDPKPLFEPSLVGEKLPLETKGPKTIRVVAESVSH